ncbi:hypothetical protein TNCV_3665371 [Trichonephila clavipes]|nr:hypothetical protein TNCV_3665371 [Trichonephila clavipes]
MHLELSDYQLLNGITLEIRRALRITHIMECLVDRYVALCPLNFTVILIADYSKKISNPVVVVIVVSMMGRLTRIEDLDRSEAVEDSFCHLNIQQLYHRRLPLLGLLG